MDLKDGMSNSHGFFPSSYVLKEIQWQNKTTMQSVKTRKNTLP